MGFTPSDSGALSSARAIEDIAHNFFPDWQIPLLVSTVIWWVFFVVIFLRNSMCVETVEPMAWGFSKARAKNLVLVVNKACSAQAITLLSLCYRATLQGAFSL